MFYFEDEPCKMWRAVGGCVELLAWPTLITSLSL
jgi:hypothetical protein